MAKHEVDDGVAVRTGNRKIVVRVLEIVALLLALETADHGHQLAGLVVDDAVNRDVTLSEVPKGIAARATHLEAANATFTGDVGDDPRMPRHLRDGARH